MGLSWQQGPLSTGGSRPVPRARTVAQETVVRRAAAPARAGVKTGPYRFTRNPIYLGMVLGLIGLAIAFNSLWLLMTLVPFALVIHYGVITREEAYLERKFRDVYRRYRARVRRWL
jgi:protein-S-isoprenylcysteine O-methyltransferase Ste14